MRDVLLPSIVYSLVALCLVARAIVYIIRFIRELVRYRK